MESRRTGRRPAGELRPHRLEERGGHVGVGPLASSGRLWLCFGVGRGLEYARAGGLHEGHPEGHDGDQDRELQGLPREGRSQSGEKTESRSTKVFTCYYGFDIDASRAS